jgi:hypothetical protein
MAVHVYMLWYKQDGSCGAQEKFKRNTDLRSWVFLWLLECSTTSRVFISQCIEYIEYKRQILSPKATFITMQCNAYLHVKPYNFESKIQVIQTQQISIEMKNIQQHSLCLLHIIVGKEMILCYISARCGFLHSQKTCSSLFISKIGYHGIGDILSVVSKLLLFICNTECYMYIIFKYFIEKTKTCYFLKDTWTVVSPFTVLRILHFS